MILVFNFYNMSKKYLIEKVFGEKKAMPAFNVSTLE